MTDLELYANALVQEVRAESEAQATSTHDAFANMVLGSLDEAGVIDDWTVAYFRAHGVEISGYAHDEATETLDLIVAQFRDSSTPAKVGKGELQALAKRAASYAARVEGGLASTLDETTEAFEMATAVQTLIGGIRNIRVLILTNDLATTRALEPLELPRDRTAVVEVWDLARLERLSSSGQPHEPILAEFEPPLPCLSTPETDHDYSVLLAIVPGRVLAEVYREYGPRLLERNVRSFLSTKGAVNKGIRETLIHSPERFLAYNNGISATADRVDLVRSEDGGWAIKSLNDLQIVNGGQTTASIHSAYVRDNASLEGVLVQMKLTVVKDVEKLPEIVKEISRFSNTQNKVTSADFSANNPYHIQIEQASRALWAPALQGTGQETKWFYERARGQYADELSRERTPGKQKAFKVMYPQKQKFLKTDVAKWEFSWSQRPWLVSRGAEKNFQAYMQALDGRAPTVDHAHFRRLIAKGILFRETEKIVTAQQFGGYRANIVTYTIAKLANATSQRIDLDKIWQSQGLSDALMGDITELCRLVQAVLVSPPSGATHVGEWTKKEACWVKVDALAWQPSAKLKAELVDAKSAHVAAAQVEVGRWTDEGVAALEAVKRISGGDWKALAAWARETQNLQSWQRSMSYRIGELLGSGTDPSEKQSIQGEKVLEEALRLGFRPAG